MNIEEAMKKVLATELPEAVVSVERNSIVEIEFQDEANHAADFKVFKEIMNQYAEDLVIKFKRHGRSIMTAEILPVLA